MGEMVEKEISLRAYPFERDHVRMEAQTVEFHRVPQEYVQNATNHFKASTSGLLGELIIWGVSSAWYVVENAEECDDGQN